MNQRFAKMISGLDASFQSLLKERPQSPLALDRKTPNAGVYLLSEGSTHLYVGRSNRIRKRVGNHCRLSATHKMAAFAFKLAREATGNLKATYRPSGSRADLMTNPLFMAAFEEAKARIRNMNVRVVAEPDPVTQAILEVYVAFALETPYNDFDTH